MRPFVILLAIVVSGSAQAQFPYNYAPYTPRYPPTAYAPPTEVRSSASMAQEMLDAHNAIRARMMAQRPEIQFATLRRHACQPIVK